ncbi:glycosyltransferase [Lacibacterium aquatile]|uniref:Glycosyltransferase n=1 Tax=Lacibacterium aquatile TaxID=1168082 RepID=A0ABW5DTW7_9PROT
MTDAKNTKFKKTILIISPGSDEDGFSSKDIAVKFKDSGYKIFLANRRDQEDKFEYEVFNDCIDLIFFQNKNQSSPESDQDLQHTSLVMKTIFEKVCPDILYTRNAVGLDIGFNIIKDRYHDNPFYWVHEVSSLAQAYTGAYSAEVVDYLIEAEREHINIPDRLMLSDSNLQKDLAKDFGINQRQVSVLRDEADQPIDYSLLIRDIESDLLTGYGPSRGVFQGPAGSAGQPDILARTLRRLGHPAQSLTVARANSLKYQADIVWPAKSIAQQTSQTLWVAHRFDVIHLHARALVRVIPLRDDVREQFLTPSFLDLLIFRMVGNKVAFHFRGSEARINDIFNTLNPFGWNEGDDPSKMTDKSRRLQIEAVSRLADCVFVTDVELGTYVPNADVLQRAIDLDALPTPSPRRRERPKIAHAPTRRGFKGTEVIISAVEALQAKGLQFDFDIIEGVANSEALQRIADADIVIDQLLTGWYGVLAVEAMALGKPVISYIRSDIDDPSIPIVNANPNTLEQQLEKLLVDADLRAEIGARARAYVESYHDANVVARTLLDKIGPIPANTNKIKGEILKSFLKPHLNAAANNMLALRPNIPTGADVIKRLQKLGRPAKPKKLPPPANSRLPKPLAALIRLPLLEWPGAITGFLIKKAIGRR